LDLKKIIFLILKYHKKPNLTIQYKNATKLVGVSCEHPLQLIFKTKAYIFLPTINTLMPNNSLRFPKRVYLKYGNIYSKVQQYIQSMAIYIAIEF